MEIVLNLIINGLPSIPKNIEVILQWSDTEVLNLIINGLPSIHIQYSSTFDAGNNAVLNLIINGLPSILYLVMENVNS